MTVTQAARQMGISASKLYQLVAARQIAHYRIGGKIIFADADIAAYLERCRVGTVEAIPDPPRMVVKLKHLSLG